MINFRLEQAWCLRQGPAEGRGWRWLSSWGRTFPWAPAGSPPQVCGGGGQPLHANWKREAALPPGLFHPVFPDFSLSQPLGPLTFTTCPRQPSCPDPTQVISALLRAPRLGPSVDGLLLPKSPLKEPEHPRF